VNTISILLVATFAVASEGDHVLKFERSRIGSTVFEAASVFDVNKDGKPDIVSGELWSEGPDFVKQHKICTLEKNGDYFDDFSCYPMDVNGDGYEDIISGGWWGQKVLWRENPKGQTTEWTTHEIGQVGNVERNCFWDVDGDGQVEIVPNTPGNIQHVFRLVRDAKGKGTAKFEDCIISKDIKTGHGLGFGDINGDGRGDIVINNGWFGAPSKPWSETWTWRQEFELSEPAASVPMIVHDVNADGINDIIVGQGHSYGLAWWEQKREGDGKRTWTKHEIETDKSQFHDMTFADVDNDKEPELVTGKRWRAHPEGDPGVNDPLGLYYYEINKGDFKRITLNFGPPETTSGAGIYTWVADVDGNGWKDIVAPGKEGLYLFKNMGPVK
jgi:hypothetical protein